MTSTVCAGYDQDAMGVLGYLANIFGFLVAVLLFPYVVEYSTWLSIVLVVVMLVVTSLLGAYVEERRLNKELR